MLRPNHTVPYVVFLATLFTGLTGLVAIAQDEKEMIWQSSELTATPEFTTVRLQTVGPEPKTEELVISNLRLFQFQNVPGEISVSSAQPIRPPNWYLSLDEIEALPKPEAKDKLQSQDPRIFLSKFVQHSRPASSDASYDPWAPIQAAEIHFLRTEAGTPVNEGERLIALFEFTDNNPNKIVYFRVFKLLYDSSSHTYHATLLPGSGAIFLGLSFTPTFLSALASPRKISQPKNDSSSLFLAQNQLLIGVLDARDGAETPTRDMKLRVGLGHIAEGGYYPTYYPLVIPLTSSSHAFETLRWVFHARKGLIELTTGLPGSKSTYLAPPDIKMDEPKRPNELASLPAIEWDADAVPFVLARGLPRRKRSSKNIVNKMDWESFVAEAKGWVVDAFPSLNSAVPGKPNGDHTKLLNLTVPDLIQNKEPTLVSDALVYHFSQAIERVSPKHHPIKMIYAKVHPTDISESDIGRFFDTAFRTVGQSTNPPWNSTGPIVWLDLTEATSSQLGHFAYEAASFAAKNWNHEDGRRLPQLIILTNDEQVGFVNERVARATSQFFKKSSTLSVFKLLRDEDQISLHTEKLQNEGLDSATSVAVIKRLLEISKQEPNVRSLLENPDQLFRYMQSANEVAKTRAATIETSEAKPTVERTKPEAIVQLILNVFKPKTQKTASPEMIAQFKQLAQLLDAESPYHLPEAVSGLKPQLRFLSGELSSRIAGIGDQEKPQAFAFFGGSGVGKTLTARLLSQLPGVDSKTINLGNFSDGGNKIPPEEVETKIRMAADQLRMGGSDLPLLILDELEKRPEIYSMLLAALGDSDRKAGHGINLSRITLIMIFNTPPESTLAQSLDQVGFRTKEYIDNASRLASEGLMGIKYQKDNSANAASISSQSRAADQASTVGALVNRIEDHLIYFPAAGGQKNVIQHHIDKAIEAAERRHEAQMLKIMVTQEASNRLFDVAVRMSAANFRGIDHGLANLMDRLLINEHSGLVLLSLGEDASTERLSVTPIGATREGKLVQANHAYRSVINQYLSALALGRAAFQELLDSKEAKGTEREVKQFIQLADLLAQGLKSASSTKLFAPNIHTVEAPAVMYPAEVPFPDKGLAPARDDANIDITNQITSAVSRRAKTFLRANEQTRPAPLQLEDYVQLTGELFGVLDLLTSCGAAEGRCDRREIYDWVSSTEKTHSAWTQSLNSADIGKAELTWLQSAWKTWSELLGKIDGNSPPGQKESKAMELGLGLAKFKLDYPTGNMEELEKFLKALFAGDFAKAQGLIDKRKKDGTNSQLGSFQNAQSSALDSSRPNRDQTYFMEKIVRAASYLVDQHIRDALYETYKRPYEDLVATAPKTLSVNQPPTPNRSFCLQMMGAMKTGLNIQE